MRRSPANSTNRSLAAFGKLQHIRLISSLACHSTSASGEALARVPTTLLALESLFEDILDQEITSNPWKGGDRSIVAAIHERMVGSPPLPDGPPPTRAELVRFRLSLTDNLEEAYAVVSTDSKQNLVAVQGGHEEQDHK